MPDIPIALLIPCYNASRHLSRLMESVARQSRPFAEIICYDDASTDDTAAMVRRFGAKLISGAENRGSAHARNQLWRATTCEWVHFHDSDDLLQPEFVLRMSSRATEEVDVVLCSAEWRFEATNELERIWRYSEIELQKDPIGYLINHPVGGINGLYRRAALAAIDGFDEKLTVWEDADLHVRLATNGARIAVVEEPLVTALRRTDSVSAPLRRNWQNRLKALTNYAKILPRHATATLISELETTALWLVRLGDREGARSALRAAVALGGDPPATKNLWLTLCKRAFGRMFALRLQAMIRNR